MNTGISADSFSVTFHLPEADVRAVDGVSVQFQEGKITGLIGESGCGKSVLGAGASRPSAALRIHRRDAFSGRAGSDVGPFPKKTGHGNRPDSPESIGFSESGAHGNGPAPGGPSAAPAFGKHRNEKARELLVSFGFSDPERILKAYPHELSGGMQQRVLCALGAACSPRWILADEPTKGLDRDLLVQVEDTLLSLKQYGVKSMVIITHDLPLAHAPVRFSGCHVCGTDPGVWLRSSGKSASSLYPRVPGRSAGKRLPEHPGQSAQSGRTPPRLSLCSQMPLCHRAVQKKKASGCQPGAWKNREVLSICLI